MKLHRHRLLAATLIVVGCVWILDHNASAGTDCTYKGGEASCRVTVGTPPGGPELDVRIGPGWSPFKWKREVVTDLSGLGWGADARTDCSKEYAGDGVVVVDGVEIAATETIRKMGTEWFLYMYDGRKPFDVFNNLLAFDYYCELPGADPPEPPPGPPTEAQLRSAVDENSATALNPVMNPRVDFGGITGLETWFWCYPPPKVVVSAGPLDGWVAEGTLTPVSYAWNITGPEDVSFNTTSCGVEPAIGSEGKGAAATWMPEVMGDYQIELITEWDAEWRFSFGGVFSDPVPLGKVAVANDPVAYPVDEYRGMLVPNE